MGFTTVWLNPVLENNMEELLITDIQLQIIIKLIQGLELTSYLGI